jgi:hypothetical protein
MLLPFPEQACCAGKWRGAQGSSELLLIKPVDAKALLYAVAWVNEESGDSLIAARRGDVEWRIGSPWWTVCTISNAAPWYATIFDCRSSLQAGGFHERN